MGAQVHYQVSVIESATGRVVTRKRRKKNLILDQGLDGIAVRSWAASFTHAVVGTGTTPTKRDSGAVTVSQTGTTLTASAGFFVADDVGRLFKADTGEERRITVFNSGTSVEVSGGADFAASEGTVWYVNQTGLSAEVKRSNTYGSEAGDNGSTLFESTRTLKRTFIFSAESGIVTYREIGWSHTASAGGNLFGRDLLAGAGVTLGVGQQLKVVVELAVSIADPYIEFEPWAPVIAGWTQPGQHAVTGFSIESINSAGATAGEAFFDPSGTGKSFVLSSGTAALSAVSTPANRRSAGGSTYVSGSFFREFSTTYPVTEGNLAAINSLHFGFYATDNRFYTRYMIVLDAPETKDSDHTLSLTFTITWGRVLTN